MSAHYLDLLGAADGSLRFAPQADGTVRVDGVLYSYSEQSTPGERRTEFADEAMAAEDARAIYRAARAQGYGTFEENAPVVEAMHAAEGRAEDAWLHAAEAPTAESDAECREYDAYRADQVMPD